MNINTSFDSGNIEVISSDNTHNIQLQVRTDSNSEFKQWFHFKFSGDVGKSYGFELTNAKDCSYVEGWQNYNVVASYDRQYWFRVDSEFTDEKTLKFSHTLEQDSIYFAYFEPYSYERHQNLIQASQLSGLCQHKVIGQTVDGRDLDLLVIGDETKDKKIWVTARQHPGETMAEWCAEGLIDRLLDSDDALSRSLLDKAVFYVVPNMNVDGSYRGNLRSNAAGANLNREWQNPTVEKSPEVFYVRQLMQKTGVDAFLDLHGDEALPYVFVAGSEGVPSYSDKIKSLEEEFKAILMAVNPDFQDEYGYDKDEPGKANLTVANAWVAEEFNCLSFTLEMPFKDNANLPNKETGWSSERSFLLGQTLLNPLYQLVDKLRS
ncbi:M14 family metallopeptidase [Kangiella sediminilitoris]|uniref:Peptidase M14 carboxypeptidase A n=1 Tax=Kangiella sediminilitoris TaxID=1144748 RepID=A0A1B3BB85_9GAMM|nr:M14-type cytosolic carboxypeptidase [Kangiella sediminilitoris]AOE50060.1 Peptidase M14 carboxypeptidase A [Kangiella sediminilitoris]